MLDWKIELEPAAPYEGKMQVRSIAGLNFSCNPRNPDGYFLQGRRGEYGLYVEGKGWLAFDENCYMPASWKKADAQRVAKTKGISPTIKVYFAKSWNEPIHQCCHLMQELGYQQLLKPVVVKTNSYHMQGEGYEIECDALQFCPNLKTPVSAMYGGKQLRFWEITTESKIALEEELERTLAHYEYKYKRITKFKLKNDE